MITGDHVQPPLIEYKFYIYMYISDWMVATIENEALDRVAMAENRDSAMNLEILVDTSTSD